MVLSSGTAYVNGQRHIGEALLHRRQHSKGESYLINPSKIPPCVGCWSWSGNKVGFGFKGKTMLWLKRWKNWERWWFFFFVAVSFSLMLVRTNSSFNRSMSIVFQNANPSWTIAHAWTDSKSSSATSSKLLNQPRKRFDFSLFNQSIWPRRAALAKTRVLSCYTDYSQNFDARVLSKQKER